MKTILIGISLFLCGSYSFGQVTTSSQIVIVEQTEIAAPTTPAEEVQEIADEGTNNPESTGATKYEVNGSTIYIKQLPLIRIEQTEVKP